MMKNLYVDVKTGEQVIREVDIPVPETDIDSKTFEIDLEMFARWYAEIGEILTKQGYTTKTEGPIKEVKNA